ncbi:GNAT family N-acetyltransferase [Streptomyces sp. AC495_CC817]|uniref:GNAT family N-acetyltransferase n=1 Tax=Streptomyces sp. AC495_CC817 TaxID=2823900 RepID=UPI001C261A3A|nr:GNAT family N-acetyltransferase [Streptomyces sp. AC495_CC817]
MNERTAPTLSIPTGVEPTPVAVRLLQTVEELQRAEHLLGEVWGGAPSEAPLALDVMCALSFTGGYVVGAFIDDEMVGVTAGFRTVHGSLHSHIAGVLAPHRGSGVGRAMKQHQLAWAAAHGMPSISWTFDPLIRRNAYFNLHRLGAVVERFVPDFYGPLSDGINEGELTDRLVVTWSTAGGSAHPAAEERALLPLDTYEPLLDSGPGEEPVRRETSAALLRIATPSDAEKMRQQDRAAAGRWRMQMRSALGDALSGGHRVIGFHPSGWYLLHRKDIAS